MDVSGALVTTDGLVSVSSDPNALHPSTLFSLQPESEKQREIFGSRLSLKHGRSVNRVEENDGWSRLKIARSDPMPAGAGKAESCFVNSSSSHSLFPTDGPQMLSFSSWKPDAVLLKDEWSSQFSYSSPMPFSVSPYIRNAGIGGSGGSDLNINGVLAGIRGPFTHSQWFELEHQALIYKYIDAKVPIPSNLLVPIRRSINPKLFPSFTPSSYRPAGILGWGSLHLGFSGNADPEPGRCRRTDGKKWRCSRDAVADQKYCERHMNRGRHRSRKRVEGHSGHGLKEVVPATASSQSTASAVSSAGSSNNNHSVARQQDKSLKTSFTDPSSVQLNRSLMNKEKTTGLSQDMSMLMDLRTNSQDSLMPPSKQPNPFEETSTRLDFGLISTDSLRGNYSSENLSFVYPPNPEVTRQHTRPHPFLHFIDDWSKNSSCHSTELSISIPMASSDFSSSTSSPNKEKMPFSPLRLSSRELNHQLNDGRQSHSSWIPISWEPTIGGPLGEVLANTSSTPKDLSRSLSSSSLNLLTEGWNSSARFESSPTGVLQKCGFGSLSSSARSSPLAENHGAHESDELLGSVDPP